MIVGLIAEGTEKRFDDRIRVVEVSEAMAEAYRGDRSLEHPTNALEVLTINCSPLSEKQNILIWRSARFSCRASSSQDLEPPIALASPFPFRPDFPSAPV